MRIAGTLVRLTHTLENNIKMIFKEIRGQDRVAIILEQRGQGMFQREVVTCLLIYLCSNNLRIILQIALEFWIGILET